MCMKSWTLLSLALPLEGAIPNLLLFLATVSHPNISPVLDTPNPHISETCDVVCECGAVRALLHI